MKNLKIILGIAVIAAIMVITACGDPDPDKQWTVTFDANGGTAVEPQLVYDGDTLSEPYSFLRRTTPTTEGLWKANKEVTWKKGMSKFDFSKDKITADTTLKAEWEDGKTAVTLPSTSGTIVEKALTYINTPLNANKYILALSNDVTVPSSQTIDTPYAELEIIGLSSERKITLGSGNGPLFIVGKNFSSTARRESINIALTIGDKITLNGKSTNNNSLVWVRNGAVLTMKTGSTITGNTTNSNTAPETSAGAIHVDNADFIMEGGSITGNGNGSNSYASAGAIYIEDSSIVELKGGTINNNTCTSTKDIYATYTTTLKLSGTTLAIGELTLSTNGTGNVAPTQNGVITVISGFNGTVAKLNLRANSTSPDNYWKNRLILSGATATNVSKFTLGVFIASPQSGTPISISALYKLADTGSIGSLVIK